MKKSIGKLKLGIAGCGAVGIRIASSVSKELKDHFVLSALYDIDAGKALKLSKVLKAVRVVKSSVTNMISSSDVVVECVNTPAAAEIVKAALKARKKVLAMSVGKLLGREDVFALARRQKTALVLPSGAIAGLDAVKAARLAGIVKVTLITRKPPAGFKGNVFLAKKGVDLENIKADTILFEGGVKAAVAKFPQNINVEAALALAAGGASIKVRVVVSPFITRNTHEVVCEGKSGIIRAITENVPCPDNPRTSYLAVLSGIQALKQLSDQVIIGT